MISPAHEKLSTQLWTAEVLRREELLDFVLIDETPLETLPPADLKTLQTIPNCLWTSRTRSFINQSPDCARLM
jgi:hypothetical protein